MAKDLLEHLPRLQRPTAAIGWVAGLYVLSTVPLSFFNLEENWRRPAEGLTIWLLAWVVMAAPLTVIAAVLAARMERAATGIRHPMRAGWAGVSLGVMLAAHWLLHMLWTPLFAFQALTSSYRREDALVGAVAGLVAWAFAIAGLAVARFTLRRLKARSWEGIKAVEPKRVLPRLPTPWLGALALGFALAPGSVLMGVAAVDEHMPLAALFLWAVPGTLLCIAGAAWGAWVYDGLDHTRETHARSHRFGQLLGCAWVGHWFPFWLIAANPLWSDRFHEEQLVASVFSAILITAGVAGWSYGGQRSAVSGQPAGAA